MRDRVSDEPSIVTPLPSVTAKARMDDVLMQLFGSSILHECLVGNDQSTQQQATIPTPVRQEWIRLFRREPRVLPDHLPDCGQSHKDAGQQQLSKPSTLIPAYSRGETELRTPTRDGAAGAIARKPSASITARLCLPSSGAAWRTQHLRPSVISEDACVVFGAWTGRNEPLCEVPAGRTRGSGSEVPQGTRSLHSCGWAEIN